MSVTNITSLCGNLVYDDIESIMEGNQWIYSQLGKVKENLSKESNFKLLEKHDILFKKSEFTWEKAEKDIYEIRQMTTIKGLTAGREPGENEMDKTLYMAWMFLKGKYFQEAFSLFLIKEYLSRPYYLFGTPTYDKALRLQCDMFQILFVFYLKHDFRFHRRMSAESYNILDPVTRMEIRKENRSDKELMRKYFGTSFNIKDLLFKALKDFFPNVSWRYIGAGHFAHRIILQIVEYLFELGLWTYDDHLKLIKILAEKSENLLQLQKCCVTDAAKLPAHFVKELNQIFIDIKE